MTEIRNYNTANLVAKAAAQNAVEILNKAITENGRATWVLAGGTSPMAAYKELIKYYSGEVDWSKVIVIIGDERFVAHTDKDSNWGTIMSLFEAAPAFARMQKMTPEILSTVEATARVYDEKVRAMQAKRFDLMWIGVGEDGHTLSLFPNNPAFTDNTEEWVVPVYGAPKAPSQRVSFSLKALEHIVELVIFATGAGKREILRTARLKGGLPIAIAAEVAETNGAEVRWLYDDAAWGER